MEVDPVATLRIWSIDVDVAGSTYTIPPRSAADWLEAILDGTWLDIVPGMLDPAESASLEASIFDGVVETDELKAAARAALTAAAGTKWWSALTLATVAARSWVGGEVLLKGLDLSRVSLGAYLVAAHRAATSNMDKAQSAKFEMDLDRPPTGVGPEEWFDEDAAEAQFLALMNAEGGG